MPASYQELKARIRKRTRIILGSLLLFGISLLILYAAKLWTEAKSRAEFYAGLNLSVITDTSLPASERLRVVFGAAVAAQQYPDGLIATALFQLEQFENSLLRELQHRTPHDSLPGMVFIPAGDFLFGGFGKYHGTPQDTSLAAFYIDQYPVTNFEFCRFLNDSGNRVEGGVKWYDPADGRILLTDSGYRVAPGFEDHPVVSVNWYGAQAYARSVGKRLPTEFEWEKAARGIYGRLYPWGNGFDWRKANTVSFWARRNLNEQEKASWLQAGGNRLTNTTPVKQFPAGVSPYGAYEMCGNVWEWTTTPFYHRIRKGIRYVNRGGAFGYGWDAVQTAHRGLGKPTEAGCITGFRCVAEVNRAVSGQKEGGRFFSRLHKE